MRMISLSVDGIKQASQRGLYQWLSSQDASIICLQDIRCQEPVLTNSPEFQLDGYFCYALGAIDDNQNGVAIYSRDIPKAIMYGFGATNGEDMNGRYLQADFEHTSVCSLLAPTEPANEDDSQRKELFFHDLKNHLHKISHKRRDYVICGNWGIAHRKIDVSDPNAGKNLSGFQPQEQQFLDSIFQGSGYADAFRRYSSEKDEFSYWPSGEQNIGVGLRTDLQIISKDLKERVEYAVIYKSQTFSKHAPVIIDYDIENL